MAMADDEAPQLKNTKILLLYQQVRKITNVN
jgi:hypothetical protein